jgi:hypothetical protein
VSRPTGVSNPSRHKQLKAKSTMPSTTNKPKKTWTEKLNGDASPVVKPLTINIAGMKKGQLMLIPTPKMIDQFIRKIPKGKSIDVKTLRAKLASAHDAEVTCPVTVGFHLRTVAKAAYESFNEGTPMAKLTPIWRVLDAKSPTTKKLSYDSAFIIEQRAAEGLS